MRYQRMPIEIESPEEMGYGSITCNLTESSFADAALDDLGLDLTGLVLAYGDHLGHPGLRETLAADPGAGDVGPDDIVVTPGAAGALFAISTTLLEQGSHVVVAAPNYATNIVTPRAIGADIELLDLRFEDGYRLDLDRLAVDDPSRHRVRQPHLPPQPDRHDARPSTRSTRSSRWSRPTAPGWCSTRPTATWAGPSRCRSPPVGRRR